MTANKRSHGHERVSSNYVTVEVFPTVKIVPSDLLLFPGGRWTIQVDGGPESNTRSSVRRRFKIADETIASVNEDGEVLGKLVGDTTIYLDMDYHSSKETYSLANRKANIRVRLITSIEIPLMNDRALYNRSITRVNVRLLFQNEVFLHQIGPLSFVWKTNNHQIYELKLPSNNDINATRSSSHLLQTKRDIRNADSGSYESFATNFNFSSIIGVANSPGDSRVDVRMAVEYPDVYKHEKNFFFTSVNVIITERNLAYVDEYIDAVDTHTGTTTLPPLVRHKIITKFDQTRKLTYHQTSGYDAFSVAEDGMINTRDRPGKGTIEIDSNQANENTVFLNVRITQVYSVAVEKPYATLSLPIGSETTLPITLQEENGRSFQKLLIGSSLWIENSHPQYVKTTLDYYNSTITLNSKAMGEANVKIKYNNEAFDVIRVRVVSSIKPHSPVLVHPGATIQFTYDEGASATAVWESEDSRVLQIEPSGYAKALQTGKTTVIYKGDITLQSIVYIAEVDRIDIDYATRPEYFTNVQSNKHFSDEHLIGLRMFLQDSLDEITPEVFSAGKQLISQNVRVTCSTPDTEVAIVEAKRMGNKYYCSLKPRIAVSSS